MIMFLASVLEQLDLALEQIAKDDIHYARFGLMLTDNAVELMLHQLALDKVSERKMYAWRREVYAHQAALDKALGRNFDAKVKFARLEGSLTDEMAQTIMIMHGYRNEVYHVGLRHESILRALAPFYFDVACTYLGAYKIRGLGWSSNQTIPERAKKYFGGDVGPYQPLPIPGSFESFGQGCATMRAKCNHDALRTIATLADEMDQIVSQQDACIDIIATGVYEGQKTTRDIAVLSTQAWRLAFSEEGKSFAIERGWSGNMRQLIEWLQTNYPLKVRSDPIPSWKSQAARLRANKNPHIALANYQAFITSTADIREALEQSAGAAEREIDSLIDQARENMHR